MSIVKVEKHNYTVEPFYQWDRNQVLEIYGLSLPRTPEVHFSNNVTKGAIVRQATMDSAGVITVSVPNGLLQKPYTITAHICIYTGATFETLYTIKLPITPREQPADYTIEDDGDVYSFNALENEVKNATAALNEAQKNLENVDTLVDETVKKKLGGSLEGLAETLNAKAFIKTGSYVGNGTFGEENPVVIESDFPIKFAVVMSRTGVVSSSDSGQHVQGPLTLISGVEQAFSQHYQIGGNTFLPGVNIAWNELSVSFYCDNALYQYNGDGITYDYILMG